MAFVFNPFTGNFDTVQDVDGFVTGPASASDNAIVRYDGTTGKLVQNSSILAQDDGRLTLGADGTGSLDAVSKQQLDAAIQGVDVKRGVVAASTANLTLSGEQTVDGIALVAGDRVLVKDQNAAAENGIYIVSAGAWSRSTDADTASEINGAFVSVAQGTANANTGWYQFEEVTTLGTDAVNFNQFFGAGSYTADGEGIELTGSTFSLELDGTTLSKSASGLKVADGGITNTQVNAAAAIAYSKLNLTGSIVNADINASAAIAYSKLALTSSIVNADISASAAIAYSKLALTGSIVDADVSASAAIAYSKLATLTADRALLSDASGVVSASTVTNVELGYLSGVTSAIQTQLDERVRFNEITINSSTTATNRRTHQVDSTGGAITLDLPAAASSDYIFVKDAAGASETNAITIDANGAELIDGATTYVIQSNYESVLLYSDGTQWYIA